LATGASAGLVVVAPPRSRPSLLDATCTRQTSSISSGRTLRMCGSVIASSPRRRESSSLVFSRLRRSVRGRQRELLRTDADQWNLAVPGVLAVVEEGLSPVLVDLLTRPGG